MPITAEALAELAKHMAPEDAANFKVFENLQAKYPALAEGYLRQSDYDKNMNKSKAELEKALATEKEWKQWAGDNLPIHEKLLKSSLEWDDQKKQLEQQLTEARAARSAAGGDTVDAAELARRVQEEVGKLGFASKSEMDTVIAQQSAKMAKEETAKEIAAANKRFYEETLPASINFNMDAAEIAMQHMREFNGEPIDRTKFSEFMAERKISEPKKAYEEFVRPQRDKIALDAEVAKQVAAKEAELKQQYSGSSLAGGGGLPPGLQPKGAVQMKMEKDAEANAGQGASLAVKIAAQQAAAELRTEGSF